MITHVSRDSYEPGLHYRRADYESGLAARTLSRYTFFRLRTRQPKRRPEATQPELQNTRHYSLRQPSATACVSQQLQPASASSYSLCQPAA